MADDRPVLKIGNTTENCAIRNSLLSEGTVDVTDGGTTNVNIGDTTRGVTAEDITFRTISSYCNQNAEIAASAVLLATTSDGRGAVFSGNTEIGNKYKNVRAKSINNKISVRVNVKPERKPRRKLPPVHFRHQSPVDGFTGRQEELSFLKEKLCIENPRVMVVSGLGGVGKTQLVRKFVEENKEYYRNTVWINAQGRESVEEEFKILAESKLGISVNVNGKERDFRCILDTIFEKLSTSKTLLVFDNVDKVETAEILLDIAAVDVKPHILITSRIQEFSESVDFRKLEVFSSEEALEFIEKKLSCENDEEPLADKMTLADTLKNLPLALRQATAHIRYHRKQDGNYKIRNYIDDFNKYRKQILDSDLFQKDIFRQYKDTTLTTWKITMNAISGCQPHGKLALRILHIMAYLDNVHILREMFFNLEGLSNEPEVNMRQVRSAVRLIINYSMVDDYEHQSVLSIHKLVQEVIQIQLADEQRSESTLRDGLYLIAQMKENEKFKLCLEHGISVYLSAVGSRELVIEFDAFPARILQNLYESGSYLRAFSFGTEINEQFTSILGKDHRSTILLQFEISNSYLMSGKYTEALKMYTELLGKMKIVFGEDHPHTITTESNIAHSYSYSGKYSEGLQRFEEVLGKRKIILGEDHPHTIATKSSIANSYSNLGKYSEALQMYEEVLEKRKIILVEDHPDIIDTKHNIAYSYSNLGKYSEALQMYEEVLEKRKIILGNDHPDTIHTKNNIANSYSSLGKHTEALQMYEEVLEKRKIILGDDHPETINTEHYIANSYIGLGKHFEALQINEQVLGKRKIVLGDDHLDTMHTRHNIAHSYSSLGKYFEALQMYEEVFLKMKISFGQSHPDTINAEHNIADLYSKLGRYSEALQMFEEVFEKITITLGENHPHTFVAKSNIAHSYNNLGRYAEALQMYEELLGQMKIIVGEDHPHTIATKSNLASTYSSLGKHSEALQMYDEVLGKMKRILGVDHPHTILTEHGIADSYSKLGKYSEALQMFEEVFEKIKIVSGEDHPHAILTKFSIADSYNNLGRHSEALQMFAEVLEKRKIILGDDHPDTILAGSRIADLSKMSGKDSE
ncbi:hypothetical protein HA402_002753 [Bradysia odoriphaga]|nr:hypothetical protein HA402_002753 [Bradysia odoriphaga]